MKIFAILILTVTSFSFIGCVSAQTNKRKTAEKSKSKTTKPMNNQPIAEPTNGEIKILAEGFYGSLETPFIFVARSEETYAQLQKFVENLPPAATIDFTKSAIVAAFAGTKNTGGYSVSVKKAADKILVNVVEPPKDAMTTDALTTPFVISRVAIEEENFLPLEVSKNWKDAVRTYKITSGAFESSGGLAGKLKKFNAEGTVGVLTFGDYATFFFNFSGKGADKNLRLTETASGVLKNGNVELTRLDAGSFAEGPKPPLKVSGKITGDKISLTFEPLPTRAADGFQVGGKIEAVVIK